MKLNAVRLIGFHNYDDLLIRVRGDLFVVGANESGKTTLLDAVHLALSGEQDLDWNAAASLTGPRRSGRTLQGIILRANMAGQPMRAGGSICYAVVELVPTESNGGPVSFVFGASATDMHTQVQKWGAVLSRRAEDLVLTELQPDGTQRILDRDEFENRNDHRIHKGSRGLGDYRTALANRLFKGREEFNRVTRLWRTAKSYREIASTAQNIGEVFRQVLPAPDPEPFQKIAKGLRDIAGIEEELQELTSDVELLEKLRKLLEDTRDARETTRRYSYVRESLRLRDCRARLDKTREQQDAEKAKAELLGRKVAEQATQLSSLKERLATLRQSDSYQLIASLDAKQEELSRTKIRIGTLQDKLKLEKPRLETSKTECSEKRVVADRALNTARGGVGRIGRQLVGGETEIVGAVRKLTAILPSQVDDPIDADAIASIGVSLRTHLNAAGKRVAEQLAENNRQRESLIQQLNDVNQQLDRLKQFGALLPPRLPGLDETLAKLDQAGIRYTLLFQHLEWQRTTTPDLQAAVEAAIGLSCLGTIVVSPEQTLAARSIVLAAGMGLKILDMAPFNSVSSPPNADDSQLSNLVIGDSRVTAYLEGTFGSVSLTQELPSDGGGSEWFMIDGTSGDGGARWRLELEEPRWIGERRRQEVHQREQRQIQESARSLQERLALLDSKVEKIQLEQNGLRDALDTLHELELPWSIAQPLNDWRHASTASAELGRLIDERTADLAAEAGQQNEISRLIRQLQTQIQGTDAAVVKKQVDQLEHQKGQLEDQNVNDRAELQTTEGKILNLAGQAATRDAEIETARHRLEIARVSLSSVLPHDVGDLDHFVFKTKRGSQLKQEDLDETIEKSRDREIEHKTKLTGADGVMNGKLAIRYGFRVDDDDALIAVHDRGNLPLDAIFEERREQERMSKESLNEKSRELFETIFARDLTERLRADLFQVKRTINEINRKLEPLVFGHCRFQLASRTSPECRTIVELVERQGALSPEHREQLRNFMEDRRDKLMDEGEIPTFLDYRNWFDFTFKLEPVGSKPGESLGSEDMFRGSVGAQTTHNYLLLLAQAALLFDRCEARLRLLMLDDAFYGLDPQRKELLLRCGKQLGLDFMIATPDLDGTILEHAGDSTTLLVESDASGEVNVMPFEWERISKQGDLFADPRPDPVIGAKVPVS